ncbi:MAG: NifB/NifX family molybdenum-iron cluster-binding protein [Sulfurovaceae bacterium]|nr:NifB/NifX family molybdenum-iron cluster-binding protein [Sulfurovaceae bacterium]MDD5549325.1 NifB/NifX family molybdenum-iron cluster-binding protein [Sulfurovaceae bacterium]
MKIAFASKQNVYIDEHFGWCERFFVYEVSGDGFSFAREIDSSLKYENEGEKLLYKIECIDACDIVYVLQIGPKAANMVQSAGIFPLKSSSETESIEDALQKIQYLINNNPPLWLKRILLKDSVNE